MNLVLREAAGPAAVFLIALAIYTPGDFFVSWDLSTYLAYARSLLEDGVILDPEGRAPGGRPGFVLLLTWIMQAFPAAPLPAIAFVEGMISACYLLTLFVAARVLFGHSAAWLAAACFLASAQMNFWLPRHLDALWPIFVFAALAAYAGPRSDSAPGNVALGVAAAVLTVTACTIKETAALFAFVPLALMIVMRERTDWQRLAAFYLVLGAGATAWLAMRGTASASGGLADSGSMGQALVALLGPVDAGLPGRLLDFISRGVRGYFFSGHGMRGLDHYLPLVPVLLLATAWSAWRALRGDRAHRLLLVTMLCFTPFAVLAGYWALRPSQNLVLVGLLYVALAAALLDLARLVPHRGLRHGVYLLAGGAVIAAQIWLDPTWNKALDRNLVARAFAGAPPFVFKMRGAETAEWLDAQLAPGESAVVGDIAQQHGAYALQREHRRIFTPPLLQLTSRNFGWPYYDRVKVRVQAPAVVTMWGHPRELRGEPIFVLDQARLTDQLSKSGIRYIILGDRGTDEALRTWFARDGAFEEIGQLKDAGRTHSIFAWTGEVPVTEAPVALDRDVLEYLHWMRNEQADDFAWYTERLLGDVLRLSRVEADRLLAGTKIDGIELTD